MKSLPSRILKKSLARLGILVLSPFLATLLSSCSTMSGGPSAASAATGANFGSGSIAGRLTPTQLNNPQVRARDALIATEAPGNYYIGRRWWTDGTRFWGYVREPGKPWSTARLIIMNESITKQPDRVPEEGAPQVHGFDHNYEYRLWGTFTGKKIYDPNSNFVIPEFRLSRYELISSDPGFLFYPAEKYNPRYLPEVHPPFP